MENETPRRDGGGGSPAAAGDPYSGPARLSRRQALGRISAVATAGATAWVVPEILTAKPAGGATLSSLPNGGSPGGGGGDAGTGSPGPSTSPSTTGSNPTSQPAPTSNTAGTSGSGVHVLPVTAGLANTGVDVARGAEIGGALLAGGWALRRWASRTPKSALRESGDGGEAGTRGVPS